MEFIIQRNNDEILVIFFLIKTFFNIFWHYHEQRLPSSTVILEPLTLGKIIETHVCRQEHDHELAACQDKFLIWTNFPPL